MDTMAVVTLVAATAGLLQVLETMWRFVGRGGLRVRSVIPRAGVLAVATVVVWFGVSSRGVDSPLMEARRRFAAHDRDAAITLARDALEKDPGCVEAAKIIGASEGLNRDYQAAADAYALACRLDPDDMEAHLGLGAAAEAAGLKNEARKAYEVVLRHPRSTSQQMTAARARLDRTKGRERP